ncbi:MAG: lipopolysaccharide assembly LapA domain-containing protein [Gammaproteobacteria bacterium]
MRIISYIVLLFVIVLGVSFALLNAQTVSVNYYYKTSTMPLSLLVAISIAIGGCLGILVTLGMLIKAKAINFKLRHRLKVVEKELENLRSIPIKDTH